MIPEAEIEQYMEAHRVQIKWNQSSKHRKKHKEQHQLLQELLAWRKVIIQIRHEWGNISSQAIDAICRKHGLDPAELEGE
jgi:hypothetical protein